MAATGYPEMMVTVAEVHELFTGTKKRIITRWLPLECEGQRKDLNAICAISDSFCARDASSAALVAVACSAAACMRAIRSKAFISTSCADRESACCAACSCSPTSAGARTGDPCCICTTPCPVDQKATCHGNRTGRVRLEPCLYLHLRLLPLELDHLAGLARFRAHPGARLGGNRDAVVADKTLGFKPAG